MRDTSSPKAGVARLFSVIRELSQLPAGGGGLTQIARATGLTQATTHRLLQSLAAEGMVELDPVRKLYRLGVEFFLLAMEASHPGELRLLLGRPALRRLSAALGEHAYLFVRSEGEAICIDRSEGARMPPVLEPPLEIGMRSALSDRGAATLAILAFMPMAERARLLGLQAPQDGSTGAVGDPRIALEHVRQAGHAESGGGAAPTCVAVPIIDRGGRAVAALMIVAAPGRLDPERLPVVIDALQREAGAIGPRLAPFDPLPQRPSPALFATLL